MSDRVRLLDSQENPHERSSHRRRRKKKRAGHLKHNDIVLAHEISCTHNQEDKDRLRLQFFKLMRKKRLKISKGYSSQDGRIKFHTVTASFETLCEAAEDMNMQLPTKENDIQATSRLDRYLKPLWQWWAKVDPFQVSKSGFTTPKVYFSDKFDKHRLEEFVNGDKPELLFPKTHRSRLIMYIMEAIQWGESEHEIGVLSLLHQDVFSAVYPMHAGKCVDRCEMKNVENAEMNIRQRLYQEWASLRQICFYQPIHGIKEYFGHKVAFYFAWVGFYISWLVPAAVVGLICFFFGALSNIWYVPIHEICYPSNPDLYYMCPVCDQVCNYTHLQDSCLYARVSHCFDNDITPIFAFFMAVWAVLFLKFWKRYECSLSYGWNCTDFNETEVMRPQFAASAKKTEINQVTGKVEPVMSTKQQAIKIAGTWSVVVFFIGLIIGAVIGVIVYRAAVFAILATDKNLRSKAKMLVTATAALMNLIAINILKVVYRKLALVMTDWENPRTRSMYEKSFTVKMFWFQFVNTYSSVFYIAFFKGEIFTGWPGNYTRLEPSGARIEGCSEQGCFLELCVQIIILMVGQQFLGNIVEVGVPILLKRYKMWRHGAVADNMPQWESDYYLKDVTPLSLFWEYQEVVLQYGFVTMFVAVFPLAPLIALITNMVELRIDAINMTRHFKRPVAFKAEGIGVWHEILWTITMLAIPVNAFVITVTSDYIPRAMYKHIYSPDGSLAGYVNHSLSFFNVSDFSLVERPSEEKSKQPFCRYPGYHNHYTDPNKYAYSAEHWHIFTVRLLSAFIFNWIVTVISRAIEFLIPNTPQTVEIKIKRQEFLAKQALKNYKIRVGRRRPDRRPDAEDDDDDDDSEDMEVESSSWINGGSVHSSTRTRHHRSHSYESSSRHREHSKSTHHKDFHRTRMSADSNSEHVQKRASVLDGWRKEEFDSEYLNQML